jgi:predicted nucleotidyltransferase
MPEIRRLSRKEALAGAERAAEVLAREPSVRLVFLFGSTAATNGPAEVRDADLAVLVAPAPDSRGWRRIEVLASRAAATPLDVVPLHRAGVVLRREVADTGVCLFSRTPEEETDFVVDARRRYLDFKPFLEEQWRLSGERAARRVDGRTP